MQSSPHFENPNLLETKAEHLNQLLQNKPDIILNSNYFCSYVFHGLVLNFFATNMEFAKNVLSVLPNCWKQDVKGNGHSVLNLYLDNSWGTDWDLEANPDCFIVKEGTLETSIQRDFIGIDNDGEIVISLGHAHGDGLFNVLRWALPRRMIKKGYFLLHSSCVVDQGHADFFLGHSGSGKSTMATLAGNRVVLGDDMNVMRFEEGQVFARAGGLGGMTFDNTDFKREFPVRTFNWLVQDDKDIKLKLSHSQAANKFLASLANLFWEYMTKEEKDDLLELALRVVSSCTFYELHFTKTEEYWKNVI